MVAHGSTPGASSARIGERFEESECFSRGRTRGLGAQNVLATVYRALGIDPALTVPDFTGRPMPLLDDREPIAELL